MLKTDGIPSPDNSSYAPTNSTLEIPSSAGKDG